MKVLHISFHRGCQNDIEYLAKQLDFEFVAGVPSTKEVEIRNPKRYKKRR